MKSWYATEDGLAVWLGLIVVGLALPAAAGVDLLGWLAAPQVWLEAGKAVQPISKAYAGLPAAVEPARHLRVHSRAREPGSLSGWGSNLRKFVPAFSVIFWVSVALLARRPLRLHRTDARQARGDGDHMVAGPDGRGGLHRGLAGGAHDREFPAGPGGAAQGGAPGPSGSSRPPS